MIVHRLITALLLFFGLTTALLAQSTVVCYELFVKEGLAAQEQLDFDLAIYKFEAAGVCRDKPLEDNLEELLQAANAAKIRAIIDARDQAKKSEERAKKQLIISEGNRLAFLANQEREKGKPQSALKLAYRAMQMTEGQSSIAIQRAFGDAVYRATLQEWKGHQQTVRFATYSPKGDLLLTYSTDSTLMVWKKNGEVLLHIRDFIEPIQSACFSPDGKTILTASGKQVTLWDLQGQDIYQVQAHKDLIYQAVFSPNGQSFATCSRDQTIGIWDATTGQQKAKGKGPKAAISQVQFAPDDSQLLSLSMDKSVNIWNLQGEQTQVIRHRNIYFTGARFGPKDNQLLTYTIDHRLQLWAIDTGQLIKESEGHQGMIRQIAVAPNKNGFLSCGTDRLAIRWNEYGEEQFRLDNHIASVNQVKFSTDGQYLITGSTDQSVKLYDEKGILLMDLYGFPGKINQVAISPDNEEVVVVSQSELVYVCKNPQTYYPYLKQHPPAAFTPEEKVKYSILEPLKK